MNDRVDMLQLCAQDIVANADKLLADVPYYQDCDIVIHMENNDVPTVKLWESLTGQSRYRLHKLSVGETVYIAYTNTVYKLGDKYGDSQLVCTKIIYKPRKWWQKLVFWKKKEIIGYIFTVIE